MEWTFHNPVKVIFGVEAYESIAYHVGDRKVLLVSTAGFVNRGGLEQIRSILGNRLAGVISSVISNPDVENLAQLCAESYHFKFDIIVAIGGGSVIDAAKILSAGIGSWAESSGTIRKFLSKGGKVQTTGLKPVIAVPTTAGTGSEVTPFATIWDNSLHKKFSIDDFRLYPETAIVDPKLTYSMPESHTIATGLDAVSQAFESIWNRNANPATTGIATQSLLHSFTALPLLVKDIRDTKARNDLMLASLLAGLAISQTRTGIAHSISYPLTAHYGVPHGLACSFTLPAILEFNFQHDDGRFAQLAKSLGKSGTVELVDYLRCLLSACHVDRRLREYVPSCADVIALSKEMFVPDRANNNMIHIDQKAVLYFLEKSLESP